MAYIQVVPKHESCADGESASSALIFTERREGGENGLKTNTAAHQHQLAGRNRTKPSKTEGGPFLLSYLKTLYSDALRRTCNACLRPQKHGAEMCSGTGSDPHPDSLSNPITTGRTE